jgi:hypothetical protein
VTPRAGTLAAFLALILAAPTYLACAAEAPREGAPASAEEIGRQLSNPVSDIWSLSLQSNTYFLSGDASDARRAQTAVAFQPVLPLHLTPRWNLINRPVFTVLDTPYLNQAAEFRRTAGFSDIAFLSLLSPRETRGFIWGVGPTLVFPTAATDQLGAGKYQAGPAAVALFLSKKWVVGTLVQHWWSYAGDSDRRHVAQSNIQYFVQYIVGGGWQVGTSPNILVDWAADKDDNVTLPIGLGVSKTTRLGPLPVKLGVEGQYMPLRPESFGQEFNLRFSVTPVIPALVKRDLLAF